MTDLTEQEVCIGSLGQQRVYLNWSDVKDICTNEVLEAYERTKGENAQLKEELKDYEYQHKQDGICYNDIFCKLELARKENRELKKLYDNWYKSFEAKSKGLFETMKDCKTLSQKLLQVKPELRDWLEVNFKEYL